MSEQAEVRQVSNRGFASMNHDRQREIARKGGRAAHAVGKAHEFDSEEGRKAGRIGGQRISSNKEHMSKIGRVGGKKSADKRAEARRAEKSNLRNPDILSSEQAKGMC